MRFTGTNGFLELFAFLAVLVWMTYGSTQSSKKARRKKEMEHAERMKWLEMGLVPPPQGLDWPATVLCIAVGAGVPIGSFLVTWLASWTAEVDDGIWVAPVLVSFVALGTTRKLAFRLLEPKRNTGNDAPETVGHSAKKPAFDPEAFEVVGSRR